MRFREVERKIEKERYIIEEERKKREGYKQIKPETDITVDEAKSFIMSLFE